MTHLDDVVWTEGCEAATDGVHKDELFNQRGPWDCYQWVDGRVGDRCEITWELPDRCIDSEFRCLPTECVNPQDLQSMANEVYFEIQERVCSLKSKSAQDCQCCCEKELEVSIVCDWVRKEGNKTEVLQRHKLVAESNQRLITNSSSESDVQLWIGLTLGISAFIILIGWAIIWYKSPRRKGYDSSEKNSDNLPHPSGNDKIEIKKPKHPAADEEEDLRGPPTVQENSVTEVRQRKKRTAYTTSYDSKETENGQQTTQNKSDIINNEIAFMLDEQEETQKEKRSPAKKKRKKKKDKKRKSKKSQNTEIELPENKQTLSPADDEEVDDENETAC